MNNEHAIVQLLLQDPHQTVDLYRKGLRTKHFKNKECGKAYKLIHDRHTLLQSIPTDEELARLGLKKEDEKIPHTFEHLLQNIFDDYNKQLLKDTLVASAQLLTTEGADAASSFFLQGISRLVKTGSNERSKNILELNDDIWQTYLNRAIHKGQITGIPTGFHIFDNHTMGLQPQWLVTIAGRNASFKTWVLTHWALSAWKKGNNVAIFSCEMSKLELATRIYGLATNVPPTKIQHGTMDDKESDRFLEGLKSFSDSPYGKLVINDDPLSVADVDAQCQAIQEMHPIDIIFIDSAYRMHGEGDSDVSRQRNIANLAKDLAKKYNVPVVCTVQLNRDFAKANATDKTKDKTSSGGYYIYGTDGWNQDSDIVLMINRPENYIPYNYSDFILDKFRHGPQGINYLLEINLLVPKIEQIDFEVGKSRIQGSPPPSTTKGNQIMDAAKHIFDINENAVSNDVLETFKQHQEKLQKRKELDDDDIPDIEI